MSNLLQGKRKADETPEPEAYVSAWSMCYVRYEDGPGGGYELRELRLPVSVVEQYTQRQWAPELMAVAASKLSGRVHAHMTDPESAARDTL